MIGNVPFVKRGDKSRDVHHKRKIKVCKKCDHQADDERKCHHTRNESQNQEKILSDDLNGPKGFR